MDFGQPNVEIGQKMANDQLLFLGLPEGSRISLTLPPLLRIRSYVLKCYLLTLKHRGPIFDTEI